MIDYRQKSQTTASHLMLYIILLIYVLVVIYGIIFTTACIFSGEYSSGAQAMIALFSYAAVCGSSTIVVYTNQAAKENEIKIANNKYKMKIELAKEVYKAMAAKDLDDKSLLIIKMLSDDDENLNEIVQNAITPNQEPVQQSPNDVDALG